MPKIEGLFQVSIAANELFKAKLNRIECYNYYLTMSTAPALTLGSLPVTETLAVKEPSMLKTTHSVFGGITAMKKSTDVWSPLK